jgi:hypothetical protein
MTTFFEYETTRLSDMMYKTAEAAFEGACEQITQQAWEDGEDRHLTTVDFEVIEYVLDEDDNPAEVSRRAAYIDFKDDSNSGFYKEAA